MTVETQTAKVQAAGNDSATSFSFSPIVLYADTDLQVTLTINATGVETTLVQDTHYTVVESNTYPSTGSITYPISGDPLADGETLTMKRVLKLEQTADLENQGGYFPDTQENALDKATMVDLQQQEEIDRSLRFPVSYTGNVTTVSDAPAASEYLRVNSAGNSLEWAAVSAATANASDLSPVTGAVTAAAGVASDFSRQDHVHPLTHIKGGNITSATTIGIGTDGAYFDITGTTGPIATMTVATNRLFILQFDSTPTLTHSGTLVLPGAVDIVAVAGSIGVFQAVSANTVVCVAWQSGSGQIYNTALQAGFGGDMTGTNLAVQTYGEWVMGEGGTFTGESGYVDTAGVGSDVIVDIEKNGSTIYSTKPEFAAGAKTLTAGVLKTDGTEDFVAADRISFKVTQIGSSTAGQKLRFTVKASVS